MNRPERVYKDSELLQLSAIQHLLFCERQCALIHIEGLWEENYFTAQGRNLHKRVDQGGTRPGNDIRVEYGLMLRSYALGLYGKADAVEFVRKTANGGEIWTPRPVEYKRGRPKAETLDWDRVQLCAQAICLEEQLGTPVKYGFLFYRKTRRREKVPFDRKLRQKTADSAKRLHELIFSGITPPPSRSSKCSRCSMKDLCMPEIGVDLSVHDFINSALDSL